MTRTHQTIGAMVALALFFGFGLPLMLALAVSP